MFGVRAATAVAMITISVVVAGCGIAPRRPDANVETIGMPALAERLLAGSEEARLVARDQQVDARVVRVPGATPLNLALQIVRNRQLREFARSSGGTFALDWQLVSAAKNVAGVLLTTVITDANRVRTVVPTTLFFDAESSQVYTGHALIDAGHWDAFVAEARRIATADPKLDTSRVALALAQPSAGLGDGPAIGFSDAGDLVLAFRSGLVRATDIPTWIRIEGAVAEPWLTTLGRRARAGARYASTFDGTAPRMLSAPAIVAGAVGTRPSADVVPDCTKLRCVALTFDDGPSAGAESVQRTLSRAGAGATFFLQGSAVASDPGTVLQLAASGSEIGSHGWDSQLLTRLSESSLRGNLDKTTEAIRSVTGDRAVLLRPTAGVHSRRVGEVAAAQGLVLIQWDVDTMDWKSGDPAVTQELAAKAKPGSIVVLHDRIETTVEVLPAIVANLQAQGFTLLPVGELASPGALVPGTCHRAVPPAADRTCW